MQLCPSNAGGGLCEEICVPAGADDATAPWTVWAMDSDVGNKQISVERFGTTIGVMENIWLADKSQRTPFDFTPVCERSAAPAFGIMKPLIAKDQLLTAEFSTGLLAADLGNTFDA